MLTVAEKLFPIKGSGTSKTLPYPAVHNYIDHIWEYPRPAPPGLYQLANARQDMGG